jgi:nucleoside-diphosphate-sugar epimerase
MTSSLRLVVQEALDRYDANEIYSPERAIVLGAGGHLGIWATLYWNNLALDSVDLRVLTAVTSHPEELLRALRETQETCDGLEILESDDPSWYSRLANADLVFDFRLPDTSRNLSDQLLQKATFESNLNEMHYMCKPGAKIVIPSSGAVYGSTRESSVPLMEPDSKSGLDLTIYGLSKLESESLCRNGRSDLTFLNPRIFTCLGPYIRSTSPLITNAFFRAARDTGLIKVSAGPKILRDFTSVLDIQIQLYLWLSRETESHRVLNVGGAGPTAIQEFARIVAKEFDASTEYSSVNPTIDYYVPDVSALKNLIGDFSVASLQTQVRQTAEFFRNQG